MLSELLKDIELSVGTFLLRRYKRKDGKKYTYSRDKLRIHGYWLPHQIELKADDLTSTPVEIVVNAAHGTAKWSVTRVAAPCIHTDAGVWCRYEYGVESGVRIMLRLETGSDVMTPILDYYR